MSYLGDFKKILEKYKKQLLTARIRLVLIMYIAMIIALILGLFTPLPSTYANYLAELYENVIIKEFVARKSFLSKASFILLNNVRIMILAIVPFIGPVFIIYSSYNAGLILNALLITGRYKVTRIQLLLSMLSLPHTWIEFLAFSLVAAESLFVSIGMLKHSKLKDEFFYMMLIVMLSLGLLIVSAIIETYIITLFGIE